MSGPKPTRDQGDLAEMLETLLDKGVVINADIAVSVGDTELLGVKLRAAVASFETAAEYGLEFPGGTDMDRVARAADVDRIPADDENVSEVLLEDSDALSSRTTSDAVETGDSVPTDDREQSTGRTERDDQQ
ncbi:gas vesicle protein GvpJ [Halorubellus salinus]|uniref:gas vesicle protein GvpJ n=1 Tax=Halorubellus salinus TaxID=755309 RepID=UPI001D064112|nr:gas vesicle protein [Halorubellus salinus]